MHSTQLFQLLSSLDEKEFQQFGDYVRSPFHNKSKNCVRLLSIIEKEYPDLQSFKLANEIVFVQIFGKKKYDTSLRNLMSQLKKLVEEFLIFLEFQEESYFQEHLLLQALRKRRQKAHFQRKIKQIKNRYKQVSTRSIDYFYADYLITKDTYIFDIGDLKAKKRTSVSDLIRSFDTFTILNKLKYCCILASNKGIEMVRNDVFLFENLLNEISNFEFQKNASINIYVCVLQMLLHEKESIYLEKLKNLLKNESHVLEPADLLNIYQMAVNFCIRKWNRGEIKYVNDLWVLYEQMLEKGLLHSNGFLIHQSFKNLIIIGLRLQKISEVKLYIEKYKGDIAENVRESVSAYYLGLLHFYKNQFSQALKTLISVAYISKGYELGYKIVILKCYYELNESIVLINFSDSFQTYIRSQKSMTKTKQKGYLSFIQIAVMIFRLKNDLKTRKTKRQIIQNLNEKTWISDKQWLLEKLEEIY